RCGAMADDRRPADAAAPRRGPAAGMAAAPGAGQDPFPAVRPFVEGAMKMIRGKSGMRALFLLLAVAVLPLPPGAARRHSLADGFTTELRDSIRIACRERELMASFRWEHTREGEEKFRLLPRTEYGLWLNTQLEIDAPFEFGQAVEDDEFN